MARLDMLDLIGVVRELTGDTGTSPKVTDDAIERALDRHRRDYQYIPLQVRETITPAGYAEYREFFAEGGNWDNGSTFQSNSYAMLEPTESYALQGRWVFDPPLTYTSVYIRGTRYDVFGAAADVVGYMMSVAAPSFDFSRGSRSYSHSQTSKNLESLQKNLRAQQWVQAGTQIRSDLW